MFFTAPTPFRSAFFATKRHMAGTPLTRASRAKPLRLARLPIPRLRDTLDGYLQSLEPFLLDNEAREGPSFDDAIRRRVKMVEDFEHGLGRTLQERLEELDKESPYNWLDDNIWLKKAYLEVRSPLPINSNWWLAYKDDPSVPETMRKGENLGNTHAGISSWQIRRATWLLSRTLQFKERIESQDLYPNATYTGLWMRDTVPRMFSVCRIPQTSCDRLSTAQSWSPSRKKVIVMLHDWIYAMDVYDGGSNTIFDHEKLEKQLGGIVLDVEHRLASGEEALPIGVLTSDDRETWTKNYNYLGELSRTNQRTLQTIQDSLMAVSLDHYTYETTDPYPSELKSHLHNIRSGVNARNRWFDKGITLIVENNGRAGMMGEHSPVDALVPSIVADYSLTADIESELDWVPLEPFRPAKVSAESQGWERLDWVVDGHLAQQCADAENRAKELISDSDDDVLWFTEYGTNWIKETALLSPDAFIQMAMQLAWYRMRGSFTATYETALTRLFLHGRTETIRTLTKESRQFVLAMCDPSASTETRLSLLQQTIKTHVRLTKAAATGKGIDRHLLGLRFVMRDDESCSLLEDELFAKSQKWKLSTSGLSAGTCFRGTGFGTPYHDGYGINYLAAPDIIKFGIESKFSCPETSTEKFKNAIFLTLVEMKSLIQDSPIKSNNLDVPRSRL